MMRRLPIFILALLALPAFGAGSQRQLLGSEQFAAGELENLILDADGALHLSPLAASTQSLDAFYVWSMARDAEGRLVLGTGDGGALFRQEGEQLLPWAQTLALEILCLMPDGDRMLAGSSPDGIVYSIDEVGRVEVALDLPQQSIWDLASSSSGYYVASGPGAKVVRVHDAAPAGEVFAELPATNATRLCVQDAALWIGTESPALVLRAPLGDASALQTLFEAPEQEIRAIVPAGDGAVHVLSLDLSSANGEKALSRITWLSENGESETVHLGEERLLALARLPDGALIAADAKARQIVRIERGVKVVLHALEQGDPISLRVERQGEIFVGTGNLGSLLRLTPGENESGRFQSPVIALDQVARWGSVDAYPSSEALHFRARSGVRAEPDDSWSEWSSAQRLGGVPSIPVAPYLQLSLEFERGAPPLSAVHLNYRQRNLAPRVSELRLLDTDARMMRGSSGSSPGPVSQVLDDGLSVEFSVQRSQEEAEAEQSAWARGIRVVTWTSEDANEDRLSHAIDVAPWPGEEWSSLGEEIEMSPFAWDTRAWSDGSYRVRVRASDARDNSLGDAREGEAISAVIHVDNTAPSIESLRLEGDRLRAELTDAGSPLSELSWRDDDRAWQKLDVVDGVLDGRREQLDVELPAAKGRIRLRLVDAAGNVRLAEISPR